MNHSYLSPSRTIIQYCPASPRNSETVERRQEFLETFSEEVYGFKSEKPNTTLADQGTYAHDALHKAVMENTNIESTLEMYGWKDPSNILVERLEQLTLVYKEEIAKSDCAAMEDYIPEKALGSHGFCDFWYIQGETLHVRDLKTGRVPVGAEGNWQLMRYAQGICTQHKRYISDIVIHIDAVMFKSSSHQLSVDSLGRWYKSELIPAIIAAFKPNPRENVGDHCRYCYGKGVCTTFASKQGRKKNPTLHTDAYHELPTKELESLYLEMKRSVAGIPQVEAELKNRLEMGEELTHVTLDPAKPRKIVVGDVQEIELDSDVVLFRPKAFKPWRQIEKLLTDDSEVFKFLEAHKPQLFDFEFIHHHLLELVDDEFIQPLIKPQKLKTKTALRAIFVDNPVAIDILNTTVDSDLFEGLKPHVTKSLLMRKKALTANQLESLIGFDVNNYVKNQQPSKKLNIIKGK